MNDAIEHVIGVMQAVRKSRGDATNKFTSPYAAGYDCGVNGPNEMNCHFGWFNSEANARQWENGKRAATAKLAAGDHP